MPTYNIKTIAQCPSGGHITFSLTGDVNATEDIYIADIVGQDVTGPELRQFLMQALELHMRGKTLAQVRTELTSSTGAVITI